jgi:iron complex outermembrane receptor protein
MSKIFSICLVFILSVMLSSAQLPSDTIHLKQVTIAGLKQQNKPEGSFQQSIDSITLMQYQDATLAELLNDASSVFIKTYGPSGIASASSRGGNASHTAVIWNGFNINNPMLAQTDFSLIPDFFADGITIQQGGGGTLWGSGAVGGAVLLSSSTCFDKGFQTQVGFTNGSFGRNRYTLSTALSGKKKVFKLKAFNEYSRNNFSINDPVSSGYYRQNHAKVNGKGLMSECFFKVSEKSTLSIALWFDDYKRQLPPPLMQNSFADQSDQNIRSTAQWLKQLKNGEVSVKGAWFSNKINYTDSVFSIYSNSVVRSYMAEMEYRTMLRRNRQLIAAVSNTFCEASTPDYASVVNRNMLSFFIAESASFFSGKLKPTISLRKEFYGKQQAPFTFYAGGLWNFSSILSFKFNAATVYRYPSLNDMYWKPGGNIHLKPEQGISADLGLVLNEKRVFKFWYLQSAVALFSRKMEDQIIWQPINGYWSAQNLQQTWSRGIESQSSVAFQRNRFLIKLTVLTNYVLATNEKSLLENDRSVGKQLIYVPRYCGSGSISISFKNILFKYWTQYTGYRYTSTDNYEYLNPYWVHGCFVSGNFKIFGLAVNAYVQLNNLYHANYQVVKNYPMPLQNYIGGIKLKFNNNSL